MSNALRLVVWDATDTGRFRAGHDGREGTSRVELGLTPAWWLGAKVHAVARRASGVAYRARGVRSWSEALRFAIDAASESSAKIAELQAWGHGGWGFMELGSTRLDRGTMNGELAPLIDELRSHLLPQAQLWLRCCSAFGGRAGRSFAPALADRIGARVVGHTYVIGVLQSGTHSLLPGGAPDWPLEEGVVVADGEPVRARGSGPWQPRTVGCLRLDLPAGW